MCYAFVVFSIATEPVLRYLTVFVGSAKSFYDKVKGKIFIGKKRGKKHREIKKKLRKGGDTYENSRFTEADAS